MFLIAALILLLAGTHWFSDAETVGLILLIPAAIEVIIYLIVFIGIVAAAADQRPTRWR